MISVIICSVNPALAKEISCNIAATIGMPHELIIKDNRYSDKGICKVYNEASAKAIYPYLCFLHEDILFHTYNWGAILIEGLSRPKVGIIGVTGSIYKSSKPVVWSACPASLYRGGAIQHFKNHKKIHISHNPLQEKNSRVAVIDGVFMAMKKEKCLEVPFNEALLKGFHCYDLDICLRMRMKGYDVLVSQDILLEHFSEGNLTMSWFQDSKKWHKYFRKQLPIIVQNIEKPIIKQAEYTAASSLLNFLLHQKQQRLLLFKWYCIIIVKYFNLNGIRYTKSVVGYLLKSRNGKD